MTDAPAYVLVRRIARGGSAEIFEAVFRRKEGFERHVAVKRLLRELAQDPMHVGAFLDEAQIGSQLDHRHIAKVLDFGTLEGVPAQVLELVDGIDLYALREASPDGHVPLLAALEVTAAVADALAYAHQATDSEGRPLGIVHRDVAPDNVLVSWGGDIKLVDFGIALAHRRHGQTKVGTIKGKLGYMAPEQFEARDVDARADVFGLGCLLHFLLTGASVVQDRTAGYPGRLWIDSSLPASVALLIQGATQPDRARRVPSAQEVLKSVEGLIRQEYQVPGAQGLHAMLRGLERTRLDPLPDEGPQSMVSRMEPTWWTTGETSLGAAQDHVDTTDTTAVPAEGLDVLPEWPTDSHPKTRVDESPPVLGGVKIERLVEQYSDVVVLQGYHAFLASPRTVIRLREGWSSDSFAARAALLAKVRDPALMSVVDSGLDDRGQPYLVCDGALGRPLAEILEEGQEQDSPRAERWAAALQRVESKLNSAGLPVGAIPLRHTYLSAAGDQEQLQILPVHLFLDTKTLAALPSAWSRLETLALRSGFSVRRLGWRPTPEIIALVLLGAGILALGLAVVRSPPKPPPAPEAASEAFPGAVTIAAVRSATSGAEPPAIPPPSLESPRPRTTPRGARPLREGPAAPLIGGLIPPTGAIGPLNAPRTADRANDLVNGVTEALRAQGLELEDLRRTTVDPIVDEYAAAAAHRDVSRLEAAIPPFLVRLRDTRVDQRLLSRRLERVRRELKDALGKLSESDRERLDREFLDLKTQCESGLSEAALRALLAQLDALQGRVRAASRSP